MDCAELVIDDGTGTDSGCSTWTTADVINKDQPLQQIGSNSFSVVKTGFGNRTLYFNHKLWRWICTSSGREDVACSVSNDGLIQIQPYDMTGKFTAIGPNTGSVDIPMEGNQGVNTLTATCQGMF